MKDWTDKLIEQLRDVNVEVETYRDLADKAFEQNTIDLAEIHALPMNASVTTLLFVFSRAHEIFNPKLATETATTLMLKFLTHGQVENASKFLKLVETTSFYHCFLDTVGAMEKYDEISHSQVGLSVFTKLHDTDKKADIDKIVAKLHAREMKYKGASLWHNKVTQSIAMILLCLFAIYVVAPITAPFFTNITIAVMKWVINR